MARESLTDIINFVLDLLGKSEADCTYSVDSIQRALDNRRVRLHNSSMYAEPYMEDGSSMYGEFYSHRFIESPVVKNSKYEVQTPLAMDAFIGEYSFTPSTNHDLRITGIWHDPYNAAADLLEEWLGQNAGSFVNISSGRHSISGGVTSLGVHQSYIKSLRARSERSVVGAQVGMYRDDWAPGTDYLPGDRFIF